MKTISHWFLSMAILTAVNVQGQERRLSLDEALIIARENNRALKIEMLQAKAAQEQTSIAKADLLPTISASGGYSYYVDRQVIFMPGAFTGNETEPVVDVAVGGKNVFNSSILLHQPVISEASRRKVKAAQINESISKMNVKDHQANLIMDVTAKYYKAMLIQESISLNKQSLDRNLRSLEDSRMLLLQGKGLKIDTLRNFIVTENLRTSINHLENEKKVLLLDLQQSLGIRKEESLVLTDSLTHDAEVRYFAAVESVYSDAIQHRPDIQSKKLMVELEKTLLRQSKAKRLPTLSFIASYQIQAQADDSNFGSYHWPKTSFVGLQANVPIFSGNRINARVRQAEIEWESSLLSLEDATEKANTEIASLQNNLKERLQRLSVQKQTIYAAENNFRIVSDRYKHGLSSRLELSDAELALTEAKLNQVNLIFSVKMAKLQLDKALGILQ